MTMHLYRIVNQENGKQYIGQSKDVIKRFKSHGYKLNNQSHENRHLQNAWNLYGSSSFNFSVIGEYSSLEELNRSEVEHITTSGSLSPNGYNIYVGGDNYSRSEESRLRMSRAQLGNTKGKGNKGRVLAESTKELLRKHNTGKKQSTETVERRRQKLVGKKRTPEQCRRISEAKKRNNELRRMHND